METSSELLSKAYTKIGGQTYYVFTSDELRDYMSKILDETLNNINTL